MTKRKILLSVIALLCCCNIMGSSVKKFFNLTADEVKIDSVLPRFACSLPLGGAWADSVYTVKIEYPEFYDMSSGDIERCVKIAGDSMPEMPEIEVNVVVERKRGHLEVSFVPVVVRDGQWKKLVSFMLDVEAKPVSAPLKSSAISVTAQSSVAPADRYAASSVLAEGSWAKIRVPSTGIYQITDALIRRAGFSDMSRVKVYGYGGALQNESLEADDLIAYDDLKEVPTCYVDGRRLFRAQGPVSWSSNTTTTRTRNPYSDYGYYFLTESDGEPLTVDSTAFVDSFYPSADDYHFLHEIDNYAWYQGGRNLYENTPINAGTSKTYILENSSPCQGIRKVYASVTAGQATTVQIKINGSDTRTFTMTFGEYDHGKSVSMTYSNAYASPSDTVTITTVSGGPVRLDYISVTQDEPRPRPVLSGTEFSVPEYVYNITNQNHHADEAADMIIIVPASAALTAQAQRIKELHEEKDGMRVRIVPADELYNEFSSGTPDANAYRRYLKMLYDRAETEADMPSHLLLFGDCVWDNRMNTQDCSSLSQDDFLLCYESENSFSATNCYVDDGFFCLLDDGEGGNLRTDKLDMAVGRFPVRTAAEAKIMVDKTINYIENDNAGSWQNVMMFMGDDGNENQHMKDADEMASLVETINPAFQVKRVMWDAYSCVTTSTGNTYPDVTKIITQQQNSGALIMNYSGHGRADQISHERVLTLTDFSGFTNTNLPLWITASCDIMPFDSQQQNIGETALLNSNGGAVAFYGTTRTVYVDRNRAINRAYLSALLTPQDGEYVSIGEAQRLAKNVLITSSSDTTVNKLQYSLLGDPALKLNIPKMLIVVDSINDVPLLSADTLPQLKAGSIATVKGHVETATGDVDSEFTGVVTLTVRDAEKLVVCKLNNTSSEGASTPFEYYDRSNTLFNGTDSVRAGKFSMAFAVGKDIDYSDESGLINVFAINTETKEIVNGYSEDFIVGGTGSLDNDGIGPSIYCYLNSPTFSNGGNVNSTPYFVAEIYDKDGINTTGSGIGHDLVLTIDGDADKTYILNDNFTYDFGSYTSGYTYYSIPELDAGAHTLRFRAWDLMNNLSTTELTFNVVNGLAPRLIDINCTSNPASVSTTFIINHDMAGSTLDVEIEVFDMSGRPLWKHTESGVATDNNYTIDWDLTGSNGGKLQTGVYLYRVKIGCNGSSMASKAKKLIVIS